MKTARQATSDAYVTLTGLAVDVFGFKAAALEYGERQLAIAGMVAQRTQQVAADVLVERLQRLPEGRLLIEVHLWAAGR